MMFQPRTKKDVMTTVQLMSKTKMMMLKVLLKFDMLGTWSDQEWRTSWRTNQTKETYHCWFFHDEEDQFFVGENKFCTAVSYNDGDPACIDAGDDWFLDAEDKFCDGVPNDDDD